MMDWQGVGVILTVLPIAVPLAAAIFYAIGVGRSPGDLW